MKIQLAIVGVVLIAGGIMFFPETVSQLPEGKTIFDALVTDALNIKEYNTNTNQVADTSVSYTHLTLPTTPYV